jgi:DNA-binding winged helix-turn-helix (wHTH) protein
VCLGNTFVEEGNLARNISSLRKALGEHLRELEYIATVARRGYRFIAQVDELYENDARSSGHQRTRPQSLLEMRPQQISPSGGLQSP